MSCSVDWGGGGGQVNGEAGGEHADVLPTQAIQGRVHQQRAPKALVVAHHAHRAHVLSNAPPQLHLQDKAVYAGNVHSSLPMVKTRRRTCTNT